MSLLPARDAGIRSVQRAIQGLAARSHCEVVYLRRPLPEGESGYANITTNYKQARLVALQRRVDALLCIEADVLAPEDALERMIAAQGDVVYGLYVWRGQRLWSAYTTVDEGGGVSLSQDPVRARSAWGRIVDVEGVGLGCTLIRRHFNGKFRDEWPQRALVLKPRACPQRD